MRRSCASLRLLSLGVLLCTVLAHPHADGKETTAPPRNPAPGPTDDEVSDLVKQLGSVRWQERERAMQQLQSWGQMVGPFLEPLLEAPNIEQAYRARRLLDAVDPLLGEIAIFRVRVDDRPEIVASAVAVAPASRSQRLTVRLSPVSGSAVPHVELRYSATFSFHETHSEIVLDVTRESRGDFPPLTIPWEARQNFVALLNRSEECRYDGLGISLARRRRTYVTVIGVRLARRSQLSEQSGPSHATENLRHRLSAQLRSDGELERTAAVDVVTHVGTELLDGGVDDLKDASELLQALATRDVQRLRDAFWGDEALPSSQRTTGSIELSSDARRRALEFLASAGDARALLEIIRLIATAPPQEIHSLTASLADGLSAPGIAPESARATLEAALERKVLVRLDWRSKETEYLLARAAALIDRNDDADRQIAYRALNELQALAGDRVNGSRIAIDVFFDAWRRIAARLPGARDEERATLLQLLPPRLREPRDQDLVRKLEASFRARTATIEELKLLDEVVRQTYSPSNAGALFRILLAVRAPSNGLPTLVRTLIDLGRSFESSSENDHESKTRRSYLSQLTAHLRFLTRVPKTPKRLGPEGVDWKQWEEWLDRAQDQQTIATTSNDAPGDQESAGEDVFVLYEFDLRLPAASRGSTPAPVSPRILDGRRIVLRVGEEHSSSDRWKNPIRRRLVPQISSTRVKSADENARVPMTRYRLHPRSPQILTGVAELKGVFDRRIRAEIEETSPHFFGAFTLQVPFGSQTKTLLLLLPRAEDLDGDEAPSDAEALWAWVTHRHILRHEGGANPLMIARLPHLLRTILLPDDTQAVAALFQRQPSTELAHLLFLRGNDTGVSFYRAWLGQRPTGSSDDRLRVARFLAEIGEESGATAILEALPELSSRGRPTHNGMFRALESYLLSETPIQPLLKERILERFLIELPTIDYRNVEVIGAIFRSIRNEAGDDFGGLTALGINNAEERQAAIKKAVGAARSWWSRRSAR